MAPQATNYSTRTALVTGANSGLGFEAAAQLAQAGYARVILACRTLEKAEVAKALLAERVGRDPFETLAVDVSSLASSRAAVAELVKRGDRIDTVLLNAGMASGEAMNKTPDGLEVTFASSIIGHHIMAVGLLEDDIVGEGARVVIAGSEAANNDLPGLMDMKVFDFVTGHPGEFGSNLHDAMMTFAKGAKGGAFESTRYYATTKVFTAWWTAAMARRSGDRVSFFTVSPGSTTSTNGARNTTGFKKFLFTKVMPVVGPILGVDQHVSVGAKRYLDVLHGAPGAYVSGATYTSKSGTLVGPLHRRDPAHLVDVERQEIAWTVLVKLSGAGAAVDQGASHVRPGGVR